MAQLVKYCCENNLWDTIKSIEDKYTVQSIDYNFCKKTRRYTIIATVK